MDVSFEIQMTERVIAKQDNEDNENVILHYKPEPVWQKERVRVYLESEDNLIFDSGEVNE